MKQRVAIIGGGVAGLTAGWLLAPHHEVTLFEKSARLGGNAYTFTASQGEQVDIAVAAFGKAGYPTFYRLLRHLGVKTRMCLSAYMSFHDLDTDRGIYLTPTLRGLWAQRFRVLGARQIGVLTRLLTSMSADEVLAAPAAFVFGKLATHHDVVSPKAVTSVRAVRGQTRAYVDAMAAPLAGRVVTSARIQRVRRDEGGVTLAFEGGEPLAFDQVIFACPADQALALLEAPSDDERARLGPWRYKEGRVVVHRDHDAFPAWHLLQAYTFLYRHRGESLDSSVSGALRYEPGVPRTSDLISSQHPNFPIREERIEHDVTLRTPIFDLASCATIPDLPRLNGVARTWYCGSHFGHGLHEDAVRSAVDVARGLGVELPA